MAAFENAIGVSFSDRSLLAEALTHSSMSDVAGMSNERLEFLGDAVLELVVSERLFRERGGEAEGLLTQRRSRLVSTQALAKLARRLDLGPWIVLSIGEERNGGRNKRSVLANTVEALLGAIYLDQGLAAARDWIEPLIAALDSELDEDTISDAKNRLQERLQSRGFELPEYRTVAEEGPAHARSFTVECWVGGDRMGVGTGSSKRRAERQSADAALSAFNED